MNRITISCQEAKWQTKLEVLLGHGQEVDLTDFEYVQHGKVCEQLAARYALVFLLGRVPGTNTAQFRKP